MKVDRFWKMPLACMAGVVVLTGTPFVMAAPVLYEILPVPQATGTTTQGRAITPDGKYVVGYGDDRGFIWDAVNLSRQVLDTGNTLAKELVGVGYRTYDSNKEIVAFGTSTAGPWPSYYITLEADAATGTETWGPKLRRTFEDSTFPVSNALAGSSTQADAWYDTYNNDNDQQYWVEKGEGAPALPLQDQKSTTGESKMQGVSSAGVAAGWRVDGKKRNYVSYFNGGGGNTGGNKYVNGLQANVGGNENRNGQLWAIAAYSTTTDNRAGGMSPVDDGRNGNWPFIVDDFDADANDTGTAIELPTFNPAANNATNGIVYGLSGDGRYAVGMDYTLGSERAVLWDLDDLDNIIETDLSQFAVDYGIIGNFTGGLRRAYAVGVTELGTPVVTGYGVVDDGAGGFWIHGFVGYFRGLTLVWDETESDWGEIIGTSHWSGGEPSQLPDADTPAMVPGGIATVTDSQAAHGLTILGGQVRIAAPDGILNITTDVEVASGGELTVEGTLGAETLSSAGATTLAGGSTVNIADGVVTVTDGTFDSLIELATGTLRVLGGTMNTGASRVTLSNELTLGTTSYTISSPEMFTAQGSNLLAKANLTLSGGLLTVGGDGGVGKANTIDQPNVHMAVTLDSALYLDTPGEATFGNLSLDDDVTLLVQNSESLSIGDLRAGDGSTVDVSTIGGVFVRGVIRPGSSVGTVTIDGFLEMDADTAGYHVTTAGDGIAGPEGDSDKVRCLYGAEIAGTLTVEAADKLDDVKDNMLTIMEGPYDGENYIFEEFAEVVPVSYGAQTPVPATPGNYPLPNQGSYLGYGQWFGNARDGDWVAGVWTPLDDGVYYSDPPPYPDASDFVKIGVFQAKPGDCNGDRSISFADFNDLANNYTGALGPGVGGKEWRQGDFNGDADVDFGDFNDLANNYTGAGVEYGPGRPASGVKAAAGEASLIVYLADVTGEDGVSHAAGDVVLSVDAEGGMQINGYEVYSAAGLLVPDEGGAPYPLIGGAYMEDSAEAIVAFGGLTSLLVVWDDQDWTLGWKYDVQAKAAGDLGFSYGTAAGPISGTVLYVVPEPGTLLLLACGALGLLLIVIRRRPTP